MYYVNKTNRFFYPSIYDNLGNFALSPIAWVFARDADGFSVSLKFNRLFVGAILWPITITAPVVTIAISLILAAVAAVLHGLSLLVAGTLDLCTPAPVQRM